MNYQYIIKVLLVFLTFISFNQAAHATWIGGDTVYTLDRNEPFITVTDNATLNMIWPAGSSFVDAYDNAIININNIAHISFLNGYGNSSININGADISWLNLYGNATASIFNGSFSWVHVFDNAEAHVYNIYTSWFLLGLDAMLNIHGENFSYQNGYVSGTSLEGYGFGFHVHNIDENGSILDTAPTNVRLYDSLIQVPAPSALILFLMGCFLLAQKARKRN